MVQGLSAHRVGLLGRSGPTLPPQAAPRASRGPRPTATTGSASPSTSSRRHCSTSSPATGSSARRSGASGYRSSAATSPTRTTSRCWPPTCAPTASTSWPASPTTGASREDNTSTGQQKASVQNLLDRISVKEEANELLLAEASTVVYDAWIARTIDVDFPAFVDSATAGTDLYRNILSATYQTFFGRASDNALDSVQHFQKVRGWLCAEGRWPDLLEAEKHYSAPESGCPRTRVEDGRIIAVLDPDIDFLHDLPQSYSSWPRPRPGPMVGLRAATWTDARAPADRLRTDPRPGREHPGTTPSRPGCTTSRADRSCPCRSPGPASRRSTSGCGSPTRATTRPRSPSTSTSTSCSPPRPGPTTWVLQVRLEQEGVVREGGMREPGPWIVGAPREGSSGRCSRRRPAPGGPDPGSRARLLAPGERAPLHDRHRRSGDRRRGHRPAAGSPRPDPGRGARPRPATGHPTSRRAHGHQRRVGRRQLHPHPSAHRTRLEHLRRPPRRQRDAGPVRCRLGAAGSPSAPDCCSGPAPAVGSSRSGPTAAAWSSRTFGWTRRCSPSRSAPRESPPLSSGRPGWQPSGPTYHCWPSRRSMAG